jgi:hypothetical protein
MCNFLYLSTTSDLDLTLYNQLDVLNFERMDKSQNQRLTDVLLYENVWYVSNRPGDCSCGFRHMMSNMSEFGFFSPMDWYKEDEDEILATKLLYKVLYGLLESGHKADILDDYHELPKETLPLLEVNLKEIGEDRFLLYEDSHFVFGI